MEIKGSDLVKKYEDHTDKYLLVNVIAKRTRALVEGEMPVVDTNGHSRPSEIAEKELVAGKLNVKPKKTPNKLIDIVNEVTDHT